MTQTKQDKSAKPAAVELRDDALDRAAGGATPLHRFYGDDIGDQVVPPIKVGTLKAG